MSATRKSQLELAYRAVTEEIKQACAKYGRTLPNLVAVSKYKPAEDIRTLYDLGHRHFGENYVQELQEKAKQLPDDIRWHFIGHLQSGKAKIVREIPNLTVVETLDSDSKATKLNNQRGEELPALDVYIQVNTSGESQKSGVLGIEAVQKLAQHVISNCKHLHLVGLMTIGSFDQSTTEGENKDFSVLNEYRSKLENYLGWPTGSLGLSMGMSHDYLQAIGQGSTNVRVGSNIFGARKTKEEIKGQS